MTGTFLRRVPRAESEQAHRCELPREANKGDIWACECGRRWACWCGPRPRALRVEDESGNDHGMVEPAQWRRRLLPWP